MRRISKLHGYDQQAHFPLRFFSDECYEPPVPDVELRNPAIGVGVPVLHPEPGPDLHDLELLVPQHHHYPAGAVLKRRVGDRERLASLL